MSGSLDGFEIYPADWYFNACVHGFLEVLEWGLGRYTVESFLKDDGSVVIPEDLAEAVFGNGDKPLPSRFAEIEGEPKDLKRIVRWWAGKTFSLQSENYVEEQLGAYPQELLNYLLEEYVGGKGESRLQKELIKYNGITKKAAASLVKVLLDSAAREALPGVSPDMAAKVRLTVAARKTLRKGGDYENLATSDSYDFLKGVLEKWFAMEEGYGNLTCAFCGKKFSLGSRDHSFRDNDFYFLRTVSIDLGSSPAMLPNFFWNGKPSLPMCRLCRSYLLCYHIVRNRGVFLNTGSIKANWYINRLLRTELSSGVFGGSRFYRTLDAVAASSRFRKLLGGWTLTGLEVISLRKGKVEYHFISPIVARWLLNTRISALLRSFSTGQDVEETIWRMLLAERIGDFLDIAYDSLGYLLGRKQVGKMRVLSDRGKVVDLLKLFAEIKRRGGERVRYLNIDRLREKGRIGPLNTDENAKKNLVFRILELTRLGRREDVYHILLRTYIANNQIFPEELSRVFELKDDLLFKTGVFAYISGITASNVTGQTEEN